MACFTSCQLAPSVQLIPTLVCVAFNTSLYDWDTEPIISSPPLLTNDRLAMPPFYSRLRSPLRDEHCYGWPFGFWRIDDRGKKYRERDFLWPLFEVARGDKTVTRIFPFYSRGAAAGLESDFYLWPLYKFQKSESPAIERERTRIAFFLYSDIREKNRQNGDSLHRVDFWPFFTWSRDMEQKQRLHALSLLEPFFVSNRSIARDYSPLWSVWRTEKDGRTGLASQSVLWNLYRHESGPRSKKVSLLFGLFQYQSSGAGKRMRLFYIPLSREQTPAHDGAKAGPGKAA